MTNWDVCIKDSIARSISKDVSRAKSLYETAKDRIEVITDVTPKNCNFVFEDYYSSIMELIQAKCFIEGFNVLNHKCLGFYIRDELQRSDLFLIFDDLRYKRNSLTYYGSKMDFETAKVAIEDAKKIFIQMQNIIDNSW